MRYPQFMCGQTTPLTCKLSCCLLIRTGNKVFRGPKENSTSHLTSSAYPIPTIKFACGLIDYYRQSIFR